MQYKPKANESANIPLEEMAGSVGKFCSVILFKFYRLIKIFVSNSATSPMVGRYKQ
jgi:hypothetical protein